MALLGLGRDRLERLVLALALGRVGLAVVSLAAVSSLGAAAIHAWALLGVAAWWWTRRRARAPEPGPTSGLGLPVLVAVASSVVLVVAVVARGGLLDADGALVFHGRDATTDPLVYASLALQIHETGLPVAFPFTGGATTTTTYLPYGVMVGLHALGTPMLDVVMRLVPLVENLGLSLSAIALVRLLGAGRGAASLAAGLVVLGGDPSFWLRPLGAAFGLDVLALDTWSFFGPYLFAFNPVTPALQLTFAAFLLVGGLGPGDRRAAVVAGLLVAFTFETKVFVWAPLLGALALLALRGAPAALAAGVRLAAGVAALASTPFVVEKLLWARALAGRDLTAFQACVGCVPRYLADAALGSHDLSFRSFGAFQAGRLADPGLLAVTVGSIALMGAVALGARAIALPELWRGARGADPGRAALHRWVGLTALLGLGAASVFTTRPHHLNGLQFAWIATGSLWPFAALVLARWLREGRWPGLFVAAALVLPGTLHVLGPLGLGAPPAQRVPPDEIALMAEIRARVPADAVVLEPSIGSRRDFPSPVTWLAGRSVRLSLLSAAKVLPEEELLRRRRELEAVFDAKGRATALAAIVESGAGWVYAPAAAPLRFDPSPALVEVVAGPAGTLYRVGR